MKTLITGASGFIGGYLIDFLKSRKREDEEIIRLARDLNGTHLRWDLTDMKATRELIAEMKPDRVFHLAGVSRVSDAIPFEEYFAHNTLSTVSLCEALKETDRPVHVFLASSVHVYGNPDIVVNEDSAPQPLTKYGYSKYLAELAMKQIVQSSSKMHGVVGRLYSCIGPGQAEGFVASDICRKIVHLQNSGEKVLKTGPLNSFRRFLDARDVVKVMVHLLESPSENNFEIFNIASPTEFKISEMVDLLLKVAGVSPKLESQNPLVNRFQGVQLDMTKLEKRIPGHQFRPLETTLKDMLAWEQKRSSNTPC